MLSYYDCSGITVSLFEMFGGGGGGGGNSKKVNTHPKIPEIDLDFFRLF